MTWAALERDLYQAARMWGIQPSEFWTLPVYDFWAEMDSKIIEANKLKEITAGNKAGMKGFSTPAQWEDARRRHREKMANR